MRLVAGLGLLIASFLGAQVQPQPAPGAHPAAEGAAERPALVNDGRPIRLGLSCTNEDIQAAGLDCTEDQPCALYLELTSVESVGNKIFTAGNIHTASATLYSVLLASDDSGKTWREPFERLRGAGLDHIQFLDFENGWVGGQYLQPLPRDPFLLITDDGGKTWRNRPIFAEGRMGSILHFVFSSGKSGRLIVDRGASGDAGRYELFESPNGGETWMVREVSDRPMRLKAAGGEDSGWRLRADAKLQAFRIERQQGERWTPLAAFSVPIGTCKPQPAAASEPPAPSAGPEAAPEAPPAPKPPPSLRRPAR